MCEHRLDATKFHGVKGEETLLKNNLSVVDRLGGRVQGTYIQEKIDWRFGPVRPQELDGD